MCGLYDLSRSRRAYSLWWQMSYVVISRDEKYIFLFLKNLVVRDWRKTNFVFQRNTTVINTFLLLKLQYFRWKVSIQINIFSWFKVSQYQNRSGAQCYFIFLLVKLRNVFTWPSQRKWVDFLQGLRNVWCFTYLANNNFAGVSKVNVKRQFIQPKFQNRKCFYNYF